MNQIRALIKKYQKVKHNYQSFIALKSIAYKT